MLQNCFQMFRTKVQVPHLLSQIKPDIAVKGNRKKVCHGMTETCFFQRSVLKLLQNDSIISYKQQHSLRKSPKSWNCSSLNQLPKYHFQRGIPSTPSNFPRDELSATPHPWGGASLDLSNDIGGIMSGSNRSQLR